MKKDKSVSVAFYVLEEIIKQMDKIAREEHVSRSHVAETLLREALIARKVKK